VIRNIVLSWTKQHISPEQARKKFHPTRPSKRHLARICTDHWYASNRIWQLTDHHPGAGFAETFHATRRGIEQNYQSRSRRAAVAAEIVRLTASASA
jgi:hypothetical protein